jgi:RNA polymerase sigma-70 factor (ECF subfamily)
MASDAAAQRSTQLSPSLWVDEHGDCLYRYALIRVRKADVAEELVQETFLAALDAQERFAGQASERTWLMGILRHKILDHLRAAGRRRATTTVDRAENIDELFFDRRGGWKKMPTKWFADPRQAVEQREFWAAFRLCVSKLPQRAADSFCLREIVDLSSEEVCKVLEISATNLWTSLHRARMLLRRCLEDNWFARPTRGAKA